MSNGNKEKRFLSALGALFTGAKVDGESGFVNLMRIKHAYFQGIRHDLMANINKRLSEDSTFREELFDKLYTFFHRYFCESGSIYYRHLPAFAKTYESVYADGQDVALSWKTQMLYYVKSDVLVRSMPVELPEGARFYFDASKLEHKKSNEKREFIFSYQKVAEMDGRKHICIAVEYAEGGRKTSVDEILKAVKKENTASLLREEELQRAFAVFRRQTEADYFINKDARGFLREQFDLWLYQYMFRERTSFNERRIQQLQVVQDTAYEIIDFIAQFEDELRRIWEKPKFACRVNYVVTLDKLPAAVLKKVLAHKGAAAQVKEWQDLGMVEQGFAAKAAAGEEYRYLPLDTKHFKELELEILACLGDLNEVLDGELVHSENWQALNTLRKRYAGRIKCVHIDPPYNTKTSGFLYRNEYQHASWLTMMENRIQTSLEFLSAEGSFLCHIDEHEHDRLQLLMDTHQHLTGGTIIWDKRNPLTGGGGVASQHEYVMWRAKTSDAIHLDTGAAELILKHASALIKKHGGVTERVRKEFSAWLQDNEGLSGGERSYRHIDDNGQVYRDVSLRAPEPRTDEKFYKPLLHPVTGKPCPVPPNGFSRTPETLQGMLERGEILFGVDETTQPRQKRILEEDAQRQLTSVIQDARRGKTELVALGVEIFPYNHSVHLYKTLLGACLDSGNNGMVLDYFAGSGTTGHAVIDLNRKDGGRRKYVLIEMGEYFNTILLPRIKKVIYSADWSAGKPTSKNGSSHFLKYYTLEQYEETLRNAHYSSADVPLLADEEKSIFQQYVFLADGKLTDAVKPASGGKMQINLKGIYKDVDIAETLSHATGKPIRQRTADEVTFTDGTVQKITPAKMTEAEKREFIQLIQPYLWWRE